MKVEEIMVKKIEFIEADAMVYDAIEKMIDKRLRSLVVKPKDEKDAYGVVTARDIVFKVLAGNLDPGKVKISEIAAKPVVCVNKAMDLGHITSLMKNFNIARVFVCDGLELIGIISLLDVLSASLIERAKGGGHGA